MIYTLTRMSQSEEGTFGVWTDAKGTRLCVTAELPWRNNEHLVSCIPPGTYHCIPHNSPAHPNTWEVSNVPNRSAILIHNANLPSQLEGCIGVGRLFGYIDGQEAIMDSVATLDKLRGILPGKFDLTIVEIFNQ